MLNLLQDAIFRVTLSSGEKRKLSLSDVFARLMRDEIADFTNLRPHQQHAWHMLLAYVGALALHRAEIGAHDLPDTPEAWRDVLLDLTDGADEPWSLVVEDVSKPAFLQPPIPEGNISVLKNVVPTPDALDVLITSRNFDLKMRVANDASVDDWVYALVSLQTMEGYSGARNYGIARMNGAYSSRTMLGLTPADTLGAHLRHDIAGLLQGRDGLLEKYAFYDPDGIALLWLLPWDGCSSLKMEALDPWFVEICRRIRFVPTAAGFLVRSANTVAPRIDAKALNGVTGDHWMPINTVENKSFSLDARGFSYRVLCDLLFAAGSKKSYDLPASLTHTGPGTTMTLVAAGVTRGQGKTEGYHARRIPVQRGFVSAMSAADERVKLGQLADVQKREVEQVASALRFACAVVSVGGGASKPGKDHYGRAAPYTARLEAEADALFFSMLQRRFDEDASARTEWLRALVRSARALLDEAIEAIPCRKADRWRVRVRAPGAFFGALLKGPLADDRATIFPQETENV